MPWQRHLKEAGVYLAHGSGSVLNRGVTAAGAWENRLQHVHGQKTRAMDACMLVLLSVSLVGCFWGRVSPSSPDWPGTLRDPSVSASQSARFEPSHPALIFIHLKVTFVHLCICRFAFGNQGLGSWVLASCYVRFQGIDRAVKLNPKCFFMMSQLSDSTFSFYMQSRA